MSLIRARYRAVNTIMNLPRGGYVGLLDLFPNAAAAYSLRKLRAAYSGAAVRVRRSSDNTEQDIGFDANGDLDTGSLLSFVNEQYDLIDEDFSSDVGWLFFNGTSNISGGTLNFNTSTNDYAFYSYGFAPNQTIDIEFTISNYVSGTIFMINFGGGYSSPVYSGNQVVTLTDIQNGNGNQNWGFRAGSSGFVGSIDNFKVTVKTADGLVSTWYDQSLSNNAIQATANNQPKIVSAGSLVTENGKVAITSETEWLSGSISLGEITAFGLFVVGKNKNTTTTNAPLVALNSDGYSAGDRWTAIRKNGTDMQFPVSDGSSISSKTFSSLNANQNLYSAFYVEGGLQNTSQNGVLIESTNTLSGVDINSTIDFFAFNNAGSITANNGGGLQEVIIYPSDQSSNRTGIETNINDFYSIF